MIRQALILSGRDAAGLGLLVRDRPRAMLPVMGKPIIARVVERLYRAGVQRFVIILGEHDGQVASYLQFAKPQNVELIFVVQPLAAHGLAGALAAAGVHLYPDEPFLFTEADVLTPEDFLRQLIQRFEDDHPALTLSLAQIQHCAPQSYFPVVVHDAEVVRVGQGVEELPEAQYGAFWLAACAPDTLPALEGSRISLYRLADLAGALNSLIARQKSIGFALADWYQRLIEPLDMLAVNRRWLQEDTRDAHLLSEIPASVTIRPPIRIDPGVSVGHGAVLGPDVYLETGSSIAPGAQVSESVVLNGGHVYARQMVRKRVVSRYASLP